MTPGDYPLSIYRGDSYAWRVIIWVDAQRSQPYDMTGMVARAEIRDAPASIKLVVPIDCVITLPNIIDLTLTPGNSALLSSAGVWDLQITSGDAKQVATVLRGAVTMVPDVTDSMVNPIPVPSVTAFPKRGVA